RDAARPGRGVQHVLGQPGELTALHILQAEADFQADLEVRDLAVGDLAADLRHLEPVQVAQGLRGPADRVADGRLDAVRGRSDGLVYRGGVFGSFFLPT